VQPHVKPKKFVNYCGIGAGTIFGKSFRMTHGGASYQLGNWAAENHLEARLAGKSNASFALVAIENSRFDRKFSDAVDQWNRERRLHQNLQVGVNLELYALFQQATQGDAKVKDFDRVPEHAREWALQKHEAWLAKQGLSLREAKQAYMDLIAALTNQQSL